MVLAVFLLLGGLVLSTIGGVMAYQILTDEGSVGVLEAITITGDTEFDITIYPGEEQIVQYDFANDSSVDIKINITSIEASGELLLDWDCGKSIIVPGLGTISAVLSISAPVDVTPGSYTVVTTFDR